MKKEPVLSVLQPTPDKPELFFCETENRVRFNDQRETCFDEGHKFEPVVGKLFTETTEFFEGVERFADMRGEIVL